MEGFSDWELTVGSVLAFRLWKVDGYGRLKGNWGQVWRPGVNQACCVPATSDPYPTLWIQGITTFQLPAGQIGPATFTAPASDVPWPHTPPGRNCACGFWAYTDTDVFEAEDFGDKDVFGVAECDGRMIVGTRGVRCERARIVAATAPIKAADERRVRRNYPDINIVADPDELLATYTIEPAWEPTPDNDPEFWTRP